MSHLLKKEPRLTDQSGREKRTAAHDIQPMRGDALIKLHCYCGEELQFAAADVPFKHFVSQRLLYSSLRNEIVLKYRSIMYFFIKAFIFVTKRLMKYGNEMCGVGKPKRAEPSGLA